MSGLQDRFEPVPGDSARPAPGVSLRRSFEFQGAMRMSKHSWSRRKFFLQRAECHFRVRFRLEVKGSRRAEALSTE